MSTMPSAIKGAPAPDSTHPILPGGRDTQGCPYGDGQRWRASRGRGESSSIYKVSCETLRDGIYLLSVRKFAKKP